MKLVDLGVGTGFGELALMKDVYIPRMATIRTTAQTVLATMSRKDFKAVLKGAKKR